MRTWVAGTIAKRSSWGGKTDQLCTLEVEDQSYPAHMAKYAIALEDESSFAQ